jgi:hypothetical protein
MDQARERQASGSAPGRCAADAPAAAIQAICRTLRGGLLGAVVRAEEAAKDASAAAELRRLISAGAVSALPSADTATVLDAATRLCATQAGSARVTAAGLLPHAVAVMRSPERRVVFAAATMCLGAATTDAAARAAMGREPDAVPALLALLRGAPAPWEVLDVAVASTAANVLAVLASTDDRAAAAATAAPIAGGSTITAAVLAQGGVARVVALLQAALGGGSQGHMPSAARLLAALVGFAGSHPAADAAARAAGALPLAARAIVAAQRTPGNAAKAALCEALSLTVRLAAAGDLPALAAQPDHIRALAGAVALAADGAPEGWGGLTPERLGKFATMYVAQLLAGGRGSSDATANGFLAAGGAAHLVRRRARASVLAGARASGGGPATRRACVWREQNVANWAGPLLLWLMPGSLVPTR